MPWSWIRSSCVCGKCLFGILAAVSLSACVSSTLDPGVETSATKPVALQEEKPTYDPASREQAVTEIRQKAEQAAKEAPPTDINKPGDGATTPKTQAEIASSTAELTGEANTQQGAITDAELKAKQDSIAEMRKKARSHYKDTVRRIEN